MATKKSEQCKCDHSCGGKSYHSGGSGCAVYGIGLFGAAFYFIPHAVGLTGYLLAIAKSLVWPAILVFQAFKLLAL